jgi:hypothetical protein
LRFLPLQRLPTQGSGQWPSLPSSTACAFRCSQPPGASIRPELAGLVSCRIRSWGTPSELCSSREAARCFQRRYPRGVSTPSGSCSARESATRSSGLDWGRARSSPGCSPLQGSHSLRDGPTFIGSPLGRLSHWMQATKRDPLQGFTHGEYSWSLSRLPTLLGFVAF